MTTKGPRVERVQYDGEGLWIDVGFSTGPTYRLRSGWLVECVLQAVRERDPRVSLVTSKGVLEWENGSENQ